MKNIQELSNYIAEKLLNEEYEMIGDMKGHCRSCEEFVSATIPDLAKVIEDIILKSADEDILAENKEIENG